MNKRLLLQVGIVLLTGSLLVGLTGCLWLRPVFFPDRALESAVRAALSKPFGFITEGDLLRLTELQAAGLNIRDLRGLEYCTSLTTLNLRTNKIQSLSPIAGLSNLTWLHLGDNIITDIQPLSGLLFLEYLNLFGDANEIYNWTPLVANAQAGGIGNGSVVILPTRTTLTAEETIQEYFQPSYLTLINAGIQVIFAAPDGSEISF
jgi:hypothetical protein